MRKPIVWRIQEPHPHVEAGRDYSSLAGYGEMRTILGSLDSPSVVPARVHEKFKDFVRDFEDGDYILWAGGDPMAAFIMGHIIGKIGGRKTIKWLRWDKRTDANGDRTRFGYYVPVEFVT